MEHRYNINLFLFMQLAKVQDMFKKHRQDCEHPEKTQFDIYTITSNFFNKFRWNFAKKFDNFVTNPTKRIDEKVILLLRYQFSCYIKNFSYSKARILFLVNIWSQKWHQTREVTLFQKIQDNKVTSRNCVNGF